MPILRLTETPFLQGEVIADRYVIEHVIAEGGMGVVLAAKHLELEEAVAIKFLRPEFARSQDIIGRFGREAKAAAKIKSEHSVRVIDVGVSVERGPYIVMEFLEGIDLETSIQSTGRASPGRSVEIILQACDALAEAHAFGIIHRDIKPANLFLTRREHDMPAVKVLDFGISKATLTGNVFGGAISFVKTQSLLGSPLYMAPEQLRGESEGTFACDIWSVGAVLYELLSGEVPFGGATIPEICAAVLEKQPKPLRLFADVTDGLQAVVDKCLAKDPARRYASIAELAVALAPFGPKRARMCVERAVAVSKAAGLVAPSFRAPTSVAPPPLDDHPTSMAVMPAARSGVLSPSPAASAVSASPITLTPPTTHPSDMPKATAPQVPQSRRSPVVVLAFGVVLAALFGLVVFLLSRRNWEASPAVATATATATAPPAEAPLGRSAEAPAAAPSVAAAVRAPEPAARAATPRPAAAAPHPAGAGSPGLGKPVARPPVVASGVAAVVPPPGASAPRPPTTTSPTPTSNPTRSAIDDRK